VTPLASMPELFSFVNLRGVVACHETVTLLVVALVPGM
jgi:hypothetical protein